MPYFSLFTIINNNRYFCQHKFLEIILPDNLFYTIYSLVCADKQIIRNVLLICIYYFVVFLDRVSLCSLGYPGTHSVDQAGLKFRNLPASASQVLGIKGVCHHCPASGCFKMHWIWHPISTCHIYVKVLTFFSNWNCLPLSDT